MKIFLDTNFLFLPFQFRRDPFEEIEKLANEKTEFFVLSGTIDELKRLNTPEAGAALLFLNKKIEGKKIEVIKSNGFVDKELIRWAKKLGAAIATNDKELKKTAQSENIRVIFLRNKAKLEIK